MEDKQKEQLGKYARHPMRTAGTAFLIGTAVGASMMAGMKDTHKSPIEKIMDRLGI